MKKLILTTALALAVTAGSTAPAHAGDIVNESISLNFGEIKYERAKPASGGSSIIAILIGLLLPAV